MSRNRSAAIAERNRRANVDLPSLAALRLVYQHSSIARAAEILDRNPSSVSYAIDKLRAAFGDPLFVRIGGKLCATDRCLDIVDFAAVTLDRFEQVADPSPPTPATAEAEVVLSCNQRKLLLPALVGDLRAQAPGVVLRVITASNRGRLQLLAGEPELLICPTELDGAGIFRRNLMHDECVCVMDPGNPMARSRMDLDALVGAGHAVVNYGDGWTSGYWAELERRGLRLRPKIVVPSPEDLDYVLPGSQLISVLPGCLAAALGKRYRIVACSALRGNLGSCGAAIIRH